MVGEVLAVMQALAEEGMTMVVGGLYLMWIAFNIWRGARHRHHLLLAAGEEVGRRVQALFQAWEVVQDFFFAPGDAVFIDRLCARRAGCLPDR